MEAHMLKLVEKVQSIYAAFGRGDVPAILEHVADDCDWEYQPTPGVPWLEQRRGRAGAGAFFQAVGTELEITHFAAKTFAEAPGCIVVLVDIEAKVRRNGNRIRETDEMHVWHFGADGRVVRFRHGVDTAAHLRAWNGGR